MRLSLESYAVSIVNRSYVGSMETVWRVIILWGFMVKLMWRLSGNLIFLVSSIETPENLNTNLP